MTKICVLSDSHGNKKKLTELLNSNFFDYVFYLGDGLRDIKEFDEINIKKVCGNCDVFCSQQPIVQFVNIDGFKVMLTHGHQFKSKLTKSLMLEFAKQNFCDVVCSGHTHKQNSEYLDGILFLNPGAFQNNQYAILILQKDTKPQINFF